jgi:hypothetical protein
MLATACAALSDRASAQAWAAGETLEQADAIAEAMQVATRFAQPPEHM